MIIPFKLLPDLFVLRPTEGRIEIENGVVSIFLEGYGNAAMTPGHGPILILHAMAEKPTVQVWANINDENPTHIIDMLGAHEGNRCSK